MKVKMCGHPKGYEPGFSSYKPRRLYRQHPSNLIMRNLQVFKMGCYLQAADIVVARASEHWSSLWGGEVLMRHNRQSCPSLHNFLLINRWQEGKNKLSWQISCLIKLKKKKKEKLNKNSTGDLHVSVSNIEAELISE